jgi:hypothetical protein
VEHELAQQSSLRLERLPAATSVGLPLALVPRSIWLGLPALLNRLAPVAELLQQRLLDKRPVDVPPAPPGTRWIRYYNDALLVDMWSGEVIDVIHGFFW